MRAGVPMYDADDLCQEVLAAAWRRRRQVRTPKSFVAGTMKRLIAAYRRKAYMAVPTVPFEDLPSLPSSEDRASGPVHEEITLEVQRLLSLLSHRQRQVIQLVWLHGLSRREAASCLGITQNTLRVHEKRGFDRMRKSTPPSFLKR